MSWEPERLTPEVIEGLRLEEELNRGVYPSPALIPKLDLSTTIYEPTPHIDAIQGELKGRELATGLELRCLLPPGPADVCFALAQRSGLLSDALRALGHWDYPTVVFVLQGNLNCEQQFEFRGFQFLQHQRVRALSIAIIPACSEMEILVERQSVLLIASPGESSGAVSVQIDRYLDPFRLLPAIANIRQLILGTDLNGDVVAIHNHHHQRDTIEGHAKGLLSFGIHSNNEISRTAPDLCVVGPLAVAESDFHRHTLDVALN